MIYSLHKNKNKNKNKRNSETLSFNSNCQTDETSEKTPQFDYVLILSNILAIVCPILAKVPLFIFVPLVESVDNENGHPTCLIKCSNKVRINFDIINGLNSYAFKRILFEYTIHTYSSLCIKIVYIALISVACCEHIWIDNNESNVFNTSRCKPYEYDWTGKKIVVWNRVSTNTLINDIRSSELSCGKKYE